MIRRSCKINRCDQTNAFQHDGSYFAPKELHFTFLSFVSFFFFLFNTLMRFFFSTNSGGTEYGRNRNSRVEEDTGTGNYQFLVLSIDFFFSLSRNVITRTQRLYIYMYMHIHKCGNRDNSLEIRFLSAGNHKRHAKLCRKFILSWYSGHYLVSGPCEPCTGCNVPIPWSHGESIVSTWQNRLHDRYEIPRIISRCTVDLRTPNRISSW